jgi:hypothetical protein
MTPALATERTTTSTFPATLINARVGLVAFDLPLTLTDAQFLLLDREDRRDSVRNFNLPTWANVTCAACGEHEWKAQVQWHDEPTDPNYESGYTNMLGFGDPASPDYREAVIDDCVCDKCGECDLYVDFIVPAAAPTGDDRRVESTTTLQSAGLLNGILPDRLTDDEISRLSLADYQDALANGFLPTLVKVTCGACRDFWAGHARWFSYPTESQEDGANIVLGFGDEADGTYREAVIEGNTCDSCGDSDLFVRFLRAVPAPVKAVAA